MGTRGPAHLPSDSCHCPRGHQDHPCPPTLSGQSLPGHSDLLEWRSDLPRFSSPGEAPARCVADAWLAERDP